MTALLDWATFYEVLGSASAALTGLQFVTIAVLADIPVTHPGELDTGDAFATPTIVHFISSLFLAAVGAAPWHALGPAAALWAVAGTGGSIYSVVVIRRMRAQSAYAPVLEDWVFHAALPVLAYGTLAIFAALIRKHTTATLFAVAGSAVTLLFTGVHNAWDNVVFLSLRKRKQVRSEAEPGLDRGQD